MQILCHTVYKLPDPSAALALTRCLTKTRAFPCVKLVLLFQQERYGVLG